MIEEIPITREQAIALGEGREWEKWSDQQRALFQIRCDRLCMPFDVFHASIEKALGRPVYTHEFGLDQEGLYLELCGQRDAPTLDEIIGPGFPK